MREERHEILNEIPEFIKFVNVELKQSNIDVLSDIEVYIVFFYASLNINPTLLAGIGQPI